jgi:hypothetical protein
MIITKSKTGIVCGLDRRNLKLPEILDWFSKSKHFDPIIIMD